MVNITDVIPFAKSTIDMLDVVRQSSDAPAMKESIEFSLKAHDDKSSLPALMLTEFTFDANSKTTGVHVPNVILGPRKIIKVEDIKPGMANVGYIKETDGRTLINVFTDVVTDVRVVDSKIHVFSNDQMARHDGNKTWFVQHIWEHTTVSLVNNKYSIDNANVEKSDIVMMMSLDPERPALEYKQYDANKMWMAFAHAGSVAVFVLSPRLELPKLSDEPIPPMPGEPKPQPQPDAEPSPEDGKPEGPPIPPMPGIESDWERPITKDWWQSE